MRQETERGHGNRDALLHSPVFRCGAASIVAAAAARAGASHNHTKPPQQSADQRIRRRRIDIRVRSRSGFSPTDVPTSGFMMKVNNWFHYQPIGYKMGRRATSLSASGPVCVFPRRSVSNLGGKSGSLQAHSKRLR